MGKMEMIIFLLIAIVCLLIYNFGLYYWNKKVSWKLNTPLSKTLLYSHYISLFLFVSLLILNYYNIRPKGLSTTKIIFFITFLTGFFLYFIGSKNTFGKTAFIYIYFLLNIPSLSFISFTITPVRTSRFVDRIFNPVTYIYFENSKYRVQNTKDGLFERDRIETFEKKLLYDKKILASFHTQINNENNGRPLKYLDIYNGDKIEEKILLIDEE